MPIVGVGIDVVDVPRFAETLERTPALAARLFTTAEREALGHDPRRLAGRFAIKEALAKALAAPSGLLWTDAEVLPEPSGRPELAVRGTVAAAAARLGVQRWHVSVTHDGPVAVGLVVAEA